MSGKGLIWISSFLVALLAMLPALVSGETSGETWYDVMQKYGVESTDQSIAFESSPGQMQEIEVSPGVMVPADIWDDEYVPTYEDLVRVGFLPEDAREFNIVACTWGQIKICAAHPDRDCDCKKKEG